MIAHGGAVVAPSATTAARDVFLDVLAARGARSRRRPTRRARAAFGSSTVIATTCPSISAARRAATPSSSRVDVRAVGLGDDRDRGPAASRAARARCSAASSAVAVAQRAALVRATCTASRTCSASGASAMRRCGPGSRPSPSPARPRWARRRRPTGPGRGRRRDSRRMRSAGTAARPGGSTFVGSHSRSAHDKHRGQLDLGLHPAVVVLAARVDACAVDREVAHAGEERQVEQLGELGADLAGVGVDRVAAGEHEVERALARRGPRPAPCAVASVSEPANAASVTCTPSMSTSRSRPHAIASRNVSSAAGGPSVNTVDARAGAFGRELDGLAHRAAAVRVHLGFDAVAAQPSVGSELHLLELRNLLHQHRDAHGCSREKADYRVRL